MSFDKLTALFVPCWTPSDKVLTFCVQLLLLFFVCVCVRVRLVLSASPWLATVNYRTLFFPRLSFSLYSCIYSCFRVASLSSSPPNRVILLEPHLYVIVWRVAKCSSFAGNCSNDSRNPVKHETHIIQKQNNLCFNSFESVSRRVESSRVFESVSSYILALQPSSLFPMIIRSVLFSTPSTAQRASRMSECAPLTRSLCEAIISYSPLPFSLSLSGWLFLFDISCVVFLGKKKWERERENTTDTSQMVWMCVSFGATV